MEKSEIATIPHERITNKIYLIRAKKIMLDRDLATIYQVNLRTLNRAVIKNLKRLPKDFMLRLAKKEAKEFGARYAFTASGVAMASTILNSPIAARVNVEIIRIKKLIDELS